MASGQSCGDPEFSACSLEQHFGRQRPSVFTGELFPVVGEYLERRTPLVDGSDECFTYCVPGGVLEDGCGHDES